MNVPSAKILYVDDEPLLLEIFSRWLSAEMKQHVTTAHDGVEALTILASDQFDVLITDVNMPRMNGIELVRSLAELKRKMPSIVFVSGFGNVDEREMYGLGVEAFLSKPTARETLMGAVRRALADRSELWHTPLEAPPRHSLVLEAPDFADTALEGGMAVGRGGFSAPCLVPAAPGKVNFDCYLTARGIRLTGQGYVQWVSKQEKTIGLELAYLDENCRAMMVEQMKKGNSRSYIPSR